MRRILACLALLSIVFLSGCAYTTEGNYHIVQTWDKTYKDEVSTGMEWVVFDDVTEIYGRERLLQVLDVRPKDKENVMLKDLDLSISYRSNPERAVEFVRARGDITSPEDLPAGIFVLGETYVQKDAKSVIGETIRKFFSEDILNDKRKVEEQFKIDLQAELDSLYGKDMFFITEVKIANVLVADSIEERIQAVSLINAERIKADAVEKVLEVRQAIQTKEMTVIADVARSSGLSVDQVLEARRIEMLRELPSGAAQLVVNTSP